MILDSSLVSIIFEATSWASTLSFINLINRALSHPWGARRAQESRVSLFEDLLSAAARANTFPLEALAVPTFSASGRIAQLAG
jgi:hypothetical protein